MRIIRQLLGSAAFSDVDRHFAAFIEAQHGRAQPMLALAAALASRQRGEGHICLDLAGLAGKVFPDKPTAGVIPIQLPHLKDWLKDLGASEVVGVPGEFRPLILDDRHRLYLHRYWNYEQSLAKAIRARAIEQSDGPDPAAFKQKLQALFPPEPGGGVNWQAVAAMAAVRRKFCVISGGPGTGKTHTLVLILALLLELDRSRKLRIAVTAPTGKAAARIQDSIQRVKEKLPCGDTIKAQLPERATTIHRLLGYVPDSTQFRYNADNLLPYDVVAVDEASMVDLALMAKLFDAISPSARVILLGDKDQLSSVEAGAVLGDICSAAVPVNPDAGGLPEKSGSAGSLALPANHTLGDCVVQLQRNYRFGEQSGIYRLSSAINAGQAEEVWRVLRDCQGSREGDLVGVALPCRAALKEALRQQVIAGFSAFLKASDPLQALAALAQFRILCALREGPFGVASLNEMTEDIVEEEGLISRQDPWYDCRPIMITRNDYNLKLFNGDIGLILPEGGSGEPRAFFAGPDNTVRKFLPLRLPEHETAYALTVHKSQGSEFDRVLLVLPDRDSPVLSRELLYTGITRARKGVELWYAEAVLCAALARQVRRTSGLRDALRK
ncbi:MAG TPA: exodeoxyribonuclease V subunit alpha [Candidatus Paceibacterota bacterium]|nr:exodeoxyribonuclease V subunit alpha [Verrucomicrobiota bacterium]HSA09353.1 exodeoxyribonuclease V subunit alpha [Candidatus Paceibacterota bacterium]